MAVWAMKQYGLLSPHQVKLTGHVYRQTPLGLVPLEGAEVSLRHQSESVQSFSGKDGYFELCFASRQRGKKLERVVVTSPAYEIVGRNVEIDYSQQSSKLELTFVIGNSRADLLSSEAIIGQADRLYEELRAQYEDFRKDFIRLSQMAPGSKKLVQMRSLIRQQDFNMQFLLDDSRLFKQHKISADRMLNTLNVARARNEQLTLKRIHILK